MSGFRMRKSIKLAPGVRLNVSKRGVGMSVGAGGARYSVHSTGRRTISARSGIPGVYYQKSVGGARSRPSRVPAPRYAAPVAAGSPKPGLFAPKGEKQLFKAVKAQDVQSIKAVGDEHPDFRLASYSLAGLMTINEERGESKRLLADAFETGRDPATDPFVSKYLHTEVELTVTPGVTAQLPLNRDAVGLALAELYQDEGKLDEAIDTVEQLEPTSYSAVSLAELYSQAGSHADVVSLTEGIANEDDATALLLIFRGVALREQGYHDAAHAAFKEALRSRSRDATIRHHGLFERAQNYLAQGKKAMARKDLERILAEDSDYEGLQEQLDALAP